MHMVPNLYIRHTRRSRADTALIKEVQFWLLLHPRSDRFAKQQSLFTTILCSMISLKVRGVVGHAS